MRGYLRINCSPSYVSIIAGFLIFALIINKKEMKQPLKEVLSFTKAERRGVFILLLIISILLIYNLFGPFSLEQLSRNEDFKKEVNTFLASRKKETIEPTYLGKKSNKKKKVIKKRQLIPHPFDPNMMSHKQWLAMGLSERQANTIEKYKAKGGSFRKPEDFKKIYCISEDEYELLFPYIIINNFDDEEEVFEIITQVDLNLVSIEEIQCVKGIGPSYATRIIKYRGLLGGYTNVNQLMEVYGMDDKRFQQISPFFEISLDSLQHISLNSASYFQLLRHPYISKDLAYEISNYRKMHGQFKSVEELKKLDVINDSLYQKIYIYFAAD